MKYKKNDYKSQNFLAKHYGKDYGEFVFSGSLAIEASLKILGIKKNDYVVLPNNVCYRVLLGVIRSKATPIIVTPRDGLTLSYQDIEDLLNKFTIKAVIAVHNYGILCQVEKIREVCGPKVLIIEDAAQIWTSNVKGEIIGKHSDLVITSFAENKPIQNGFGAAIFSNNFNFRSYFDHQDQLSRENDYVIMPYVIPDKINIDINNMIINANKLYKKKQRILKMIVSSLINKAIIMPNFDDNIKYDIPLHKLPIYIKNKTLLNRIIELSNNLNIKYEIPHTKKLDQISLAKKNNGIHIDYLIKYDYNFVIKIGINSAQEMKQWLEAVKKNLL